MTTACAPVENISLSVSTSCASIAAYNRNRSARNSSLGTISAIALPDGSKFRPYHATTSRGKTPSASLSRGFFLEERQDCVAHGMTPLTAPLHVASSHDKISKSSGTLRQDADTRRQCRPRNRPFLQGATMDRRRLLKLTSLAFAGPLALPETARARSKRLAPGLWGVWDNAFARARFVP